MGEEDRQDLAEGARPRGGSSQLDQRYCPPSLVGVFHTSISSLVHLLPPCPPSDMDGCLNAEAAFPLNLLLSLGLSIFVRGEQANFDIDPAAGVEATQLYPDVAYTTVDEYLDRLI